MQQRSLAEPLVRRSILRHDGVQPVLQRLLFVVRYAQERDDIGYFSLREMIPDQEQSDLALHCQEERLILVIICSTWEGGRE